MLRIRKDGNHVKVLNKVLANFRFGGVSTEKSLSGTMERKMRQFWLCGGDFKEAGNHSAAEK